MWNEGAVPDLAHVPVMLAPSQAFYENKWQS